jgi:Fe-Mn family superoxide dismutase
MASRHPIVVFCVHGHEVSRFGTAMLLLHGVQARYVEGGFTALVAAGADTVPLQRDEETGHA